MKSDFNVLLGAKPLKNALFVPTPQLFGRKGFAA
jgi:hypothetical protein